MQFIPMNYNNTAKKVKMLWALASTARKHTCKISLYMKVTGKKTTTKKTKVSHHTITGDLKPSNLTQKKQSKIYIKKQTFIIMM